MTEALDLMASLVLEDGRRWGEAAVEVQWTDARAILEPNSPTPYHFLTRARAFSKTADLAGMATAAMLEQLPPVSRLYGLAADRDQGRLLVDSITGFARRTPGLESALRVDSYRVTATRTGSTLDVIAADAPGAYGLRPAFLIVDELAQWASTSAPKELWEATTSALAKVPGARLAVITSAGDPAHWSYGILEHARKDPLWRTHEVPGPPPWADPDRLAEQRRRLPESSYARLFGNRWTAAEDRLTSLDDLRACVILDGPLEPDPSKRYVVGVDLGITHDRAVVVVCHTEPMEVIWGREPQERGLRVVLDRIEVWSGSRLRPVKLQAVEDYVEQASWLYNHAEVILDPWQAIGLAQRLRSKGVRVTEFSLSQASVGRLAQTMHLLLRNQALALPENPELIDELANVRLKETSPGVLRMDHDAGRHDDRAFALALAAQNLLERDSRPRLANYYIDERGGRGRSSGQADDLIARWEKRDPSFRQKMEEIRGWRFECKTSRR